MNFRKSLILCFIFAVIRTANSVKCYQCQATADCAADASTGTLDKYKNPADCTGLTKAVQRCFTGIFSNGSYSRTCASVDANTNQNTQALCRQAGVQSCAFCSDSNNNYCNSKASIMDMPQALPNAAGLGNIVPGQGFPNQLPNMAGLGQQGNVLPEQGFPNQLPNGTGFGQQDNTTPAQGSQTQSPYITGVVKDMQGILQGMQAGAQNGTQHAPGLDQI